MLLFFRFFAVHIPPNLPSAQKENFVQPSKNVPQTFGDEIMHAFRIRDLLNKSLYKIKILNYIAIVLFVQKYDQYWLDVFHGFLIPSIKLVDWKRLLLLIAKKTHWSTIENSLLSQKVKIFLTFSNLLTAAAAEVWTRPKTSWHSPLPVFTHLHILNGIQEHWVA